MKRFLSLLLCGIMFYGYVYAGGTPVIYKIKLGTPRAMRNAVSTVDTAIPPAIGSGFDMSDFQYAIVDLTFGGTITACTITPLFAASGATVYASGSSVSATQNSRYKIELNGSSDFYIVINTLTGTNPIASISIQGVVE